MSDKHTIVLSDPAIGSFTWQPPEEIQDLLEANPDLEPFIERTVALLGAVFFRRAVDAARFVKLAEEHGEDPEWTTGWLLGQFWQYFQFARIGLELKAQEYDSGFEGLD